MSQKGFLKHISSVSTSKKGVGGNYDYWKHRCEDTPLDGKAILKRKRAAQEKIERLRLIKELAEL